MAECRSNLRQLVMGMLTHANDHRGARCTGPSDNRVGKSYDPIDEEGWMADMANGEYAVPGFLLSPGHPATFSQNIELSRLNDNAFKQFTTEDQARLLERGINSNYCLAWYTAFTEPKDWFTNGEVKEAENNKGPLTTGAMTNVASSRVPIIGTGTTDDLGDIGETRIAGEYGLLAKALTDGPRFVAGSYNRQDYTDFGPSHGKRAASANQRHGARWGNIAFGDGHVGIFEDTASNPASADAGSPDGAFGGRFGRADCLD